MAKNRSLRSKYRIDEATGCWIWIAYIHKTGYGRVSYHGKAIGAHRALYLLAGREIPEGLQLDHLCKTRACVNPDHLEPVTQIVNLRRGKHARLTVAIVTEIRQRYLSGERLYSLAKEFGVTDSHLSRVVRGFGWRSDEDVVSTIDGRKLFPGHLMKGNNGNTNNSASVNAADLANA